MRQPNNSGLLLLSGAALSLSTGAFLCSCEKVAERPNVLIIFTDDQGYADFGCFGSETNKTPVMDRLCEEGTSFSNFYAQPVSGPSRSTLLTGRYPIRSGGTSMPASEVTFAELAKEVGYETACIGKWDISERKEIIEQMPNAQGFDYYYGPLGANDTGKINIHENNDLVVEGETDMSKLLRLYTDKAINFLKGRDTEKPFVLYLAHTMMHTVIDASPEFKGKSAGGLYGDVVEEFDYETGRLLSTLDELGLSDNTIIIYTTDNGPWCQTKYTQNPKFGKNRYNGEEVCFWGNPGELRGGKGSAYEAGSRTQCIIKWEGHTVAGRRCDGLMATLDFMPTFANWLGFTIPEDIRIDGVDQSDMVLGKSDESARATFCYSQHHNGLEKFCGIRDGRWKLLLPDRKINTVYLMDFGTNDYELYDLSNDIAEQYNVVDQYPEIVKRLEAELQFAY
ncbi:MAG: sulfatase-like hydrolase/transferase [Rikenellaceae bacterium]